MRMLTIPAIAVAGLMMIGCQDDTPEPEVTPPAATYETTPPAYEANEPTTTAAQNRPMSVDDVQKIPVDELEALRSSDQVTIIDVRSAPYYVEGHIPGALNIPANQTAAMINMIPKGKRIVTYCT